MIGTDHAQTSGSLSVKSKVLTEGLGEHNSSVLLCKKPETPGVFVVVIVSKTLVSRVKENEVFFLHNNLKNSPPLVFSWITARWVMATSLEKQDLLILHVLEVLAHCLEIEKLSLGVEVPEVSQFKIATFDDIVVEGPGWVWHVNFTAREELPEQEESKLEASSSRDCLNRGNSLFFDCDVVFAPTEFDRFLSETWIPIWKCVFLVYLIIKLDPFSLFDGLQDEWLSVFSLVYSDTEQNSLGARISQESVNKAKDWIGWRSLEFFPDSGW